MSGIAFRYCNSTKTTTTGAAKQVTIDASIQIGDRMYLDYDGGGPPDSDPAGWSLIASDTDGVYHWLWAKTAQAGDVGGTKKATVAATSVARANVTLYVVSGAAAAGVEAVLGLATEATSQNNHATASVSNPSVGAGGICVQFYASKEGTTPSSLRSLPGYVMRANQSNPTGTGTFPFVQMVADLANVSAGTIAAASWHTDQPTDNVSMFTVVIAPASTTSALVPGEDVQLFTGATVVGGTAMSDVWADSDPATLVKVPLDPTTSNVGKIRLTDLVGSDPTGPLKHFEIDVQCSPATTTLSMIVKLVVNSVVKATYSAFTTVNTAGVATMSQDISSGNQTDQLGHLDTVVLELDFKGSST